MTESPLPVTAFHSSVETSNRILANMLEKPGLKDFPTSRLSGPKTKVRYFRQRPTTTNLAVNITSFNDIDPSGMAFDLVEDFYLVFSSENSFSDVGMDENQITIREEGQANILPLTIRPMVNDFFTSTGDESVRLYRVTGVQAENAGMEKDPGFQISFILEEKNFIYPGSRLQAAVVSEKVLKFEYVGTTYKCILDAKESRVLDTFEGMYRDLRDKFRHLFYDKMQNTFLLSYGIIDDTDRPYATGDLSPDAVRERNSWANRELYDRILVAFLKKTLVFSDNDDGKLIYPTNYLTAERDVYAGTLFDVIERKNYKLLKKTFFEPRPIPYSGRDAHPVLFGKIELYPVMTHSYGVLNLFPSGFVEKLRFPADTSPNFKDKPYGSPYELLSDILNLYINGKEMDLIIERLVYFCEESRFLETIIDETRTEFLFYVLPIAGYLFQQSMETIATGLSEKAKEIRITST